MMRPRDLALSYAARINYGHREWSAIYAWMLEHCEGHPARDLPYPPDGSHYSDLEGATWAKRDRVANL
jgi:hypothetical protein